MTSSIPLWLDCDPGHDDAFAILLGSQLPYFNLIGISTVYGNAPLEHTTSNALSLLDAFKIASNVDVYPGAQKPLDRPLHNAPDIHGESGLDGTDLLPKPPTKQARPAGSAVKAMAEAIKKYPREISIVATGTLTNVALLIQQYPDLLPQIKFLSIMGGGIEEFNWDNYAEFNIWCDPHAAQIVLTHPVLSSKTFLVPLDMTHKAIATSSVQARVLGGGQTGQPTSTVRRMLYELLVFFAETYLSKFNFTEGPPVHDPLAVALLIPEYFPELKTELEVQYKKYKVEVVLDNVHIGQTVLVNPDPTNGVAIVTNMNIPKFWDLVMNALEILDAK